MLTKMSTTKITRCDCGMMPDPCPERDYIVRGRDQYGERFRAHVHHRGRGLWMIETGGTNLRQDWLRFDSLQEVVCHLEDGGRDC